MSIDNIFSPIMTSFLGFFIEKNNIDKWMADNNYQNDKITKLFDNKLYSHINKYFTINALMDALNESGRKSDWNSLGKSKQELLITLIVNHDNFIFKDMYDNLLQNDYNYYSLSKSECISVLIKNSKEKKIKINHDDFVYFLEKNVNVSKINSSFDDKDLIDITNNSNINCDEKILQLAIKNKFINYINFLVIDKNIKIHHNFFDYYIANIDDKNINLLLFKDFEFTSDDLYKTINLCKASLIQYIIDNSNIEYNTKILRATIEKKYINFIDIIVLNKGIEFDDELYKLYINKIDNNKINISLFKNFKFTTEHLNNTINSNAQVLVKHMIDEHNILPDENTFNFYSKKYYYKVQQVQSSNDRIYMVKFLSENIIFNQDNLNYAFCNLDIDIIKEIYMGKILQSLDISLCVNYGLIYFNNLNLKKIENILNGNRVKSTFKLYHGLKDFSMKICDILQIFYLSGYKLSESEIIQFLNLQISLDFALTKHYKKTPKFEILCNHQYLLKTENTLLETKKKIKKK
jgi:hypothetical protein